MSTMNNNKSTILSGLVSTVAIIIMTSIVIVLLFTGCTTATKNRSKRECSPECRISKSAQ